MEKRNKKNELEWEFNSKVIGTRSVEHSLFFFCSIHLYQSLIELF